MRWHKVNKREGIEWIATRLYKTGDLSIELSIFKFRLCYNIGAFKIVYIINKIKSTNAKHAKLTRPT